MKEFSGIDILLEQAVGTDQIRNTIADAFRLHRSSSLPCLAAEERIGDVFLISANVPSTLLGTCAPARISMHLHRPEAPSNHCERACWRIHGQVDHP